jgi:hypothetical protein
MTSSDTVAVVMTTVDEDPAILQRAIDSYQQQTYGCDVLVSTIENDSAVKVAHAAADGLVLVSASEHPGRGPRGSFYQINSALSHVADHDWFAYASGNDVALPTKIEHELDICKARKARVCYSSFWVETAGNRILRKARKHSYKEHLLCNMVNDCALVDMELIRKHGPFDLDMNNMAFWHFWLSVYEAEGQVFAANAEPEWVYYVGNESQHIKRLSDDELKRANEVDKQRMLALHGC